MRPRIYEMGISYHGRTYAEGKKIGVRDGLRALYCIVKYNMPTAPWLLQLSGYALVGGTAALVNLAVFLSMLTAGAPPVVAAPVAFGVAAFVNYFLCIAVLFRHRARWTAVGEVAVFFLVVAAVGAMDLAVTTSLITTGYPPVVAKLGATALGFVVNFAGRRFLVFPEPSRPDWRPRFVTVAENGRDINRHGRSRRRAGPCR
jgi:putative flippase GtrA